MRGSTVGFPGTDRPDDRSDDRSDDRAAGHEAFAFDRALARLEDTLLALPFDRALPDLEVLFASARISAEEFGRDERFVKVVHEAIVARPFGQLDEVLRTRTDVELCTLEVRVLTERLRTHANEPVTLARIATRLAALRARLDEVRDRL